MRRVYAIFLTLLAAFDPLLEIPSMDVIYIAGIVAFCSLCLALATGCEKLNRRTSGGRA
jgi:hypothetical protein